MLLSFRDMLWTVVDLNGVLELEFGRSMDPCSHGAAIHYSITETVVDLHDILEPRF